VAVFTEVSESEAGELLRMLDLGELRVLRGIPGGIENTNYFVTAEREGRSHDYVLTLFERLSWEQLPFYLHLMKHLAQHGIPVPEPHALPGSATAGNPDGELQHRVCGKPAAVVDKLPGRSELAPTQAHCAGVGEMLARMHLAGRDYPRSQPHLRGLAWWNETVPVIRPYVTEAQAALLTSELAYQNHIAAAPAYAALPRGPIHGDLFRDNVLFEQGRLTGFFDFYFAGVDSWLFDIAVCLNDWCVDLASGAHEAERADAFLRAYSAVRPLGAAERRLLPALLRGGALRFWVSRLWDLHLPREAALLQAHDPGHFERVLRQRVARPPLF
jgi:homoserine kinase type II